MPPQNRTTFIADSLSLEVDSGAAGAPATYVAMGHLYFDTTDAFQAAFAPHAQAIMADIPNYTNIQPTIQISEVKL